ncbi:aminoacyl-tRNA deacylase [Neptuniibacter sp. QD29_5]|uniref:aminoacyl-tRNA deacylase n=1 Tax=Neptuniibacter sp. QD29_5 TaxID=3398207 RepID=UPI0039F45B08
MSVSATLCSFLENQGCSYDTIKHDYSFTSLDSAHRASIPVTQMAKAVVIHQKNRFTLAAVPAMNKVMLPQLAAITGSPARLAKEAEIKRIFGDCEEGAIPAIGQAYGLDVIWDDQLAEAEDIYIEAGDHQNLIHLKRKQFQNLMKNKQHGEISCAPEELYDLSHY